MGDKGLFPAMLYYRGVINTLLPAVGTLIQRRYDDMTRQSLVS